MSVRRKTIKSHDLQDGTEFAFANMAIGERFIVSDTVFYHKARVREPEKKMLPYNEDVIVFSTR